MNVLAVRQDNNGDVLLAGPALRALRRSAAHLTLVVGPSGRAAAETLDACDAIVPFEAAWIEADPKPLAASDVERFVARIRRANVSRAFVFTSFHQSPLPMALLLRLAGVPYVAATSVDYPGSLLDLRHRIADDVHEVERSLSLVAAAGYALPASDDGALRMRTEPFAALRTTAPYVVVHPGATVPARAWAPERCRELVARLDAEAIPVVLTGSAPERDLCAFVAGASAENLAGATSFAQLGDVIARATAIVVGNTGAAHVAAAVGTPVVSLFAPTIPAARFAPWAVAHVVLGDQHVPCAGCRARICPLPSQLCLDAIAIDDVLGALRRIARPSIAISA